MSSGQETAEAACSQYANAVGTLEESDELGHALETWSDATILGFFMKRGSTHAVREVRQISHETSSG